jgi:hypothetical protein
LSVRSALKFARTLVLRVVVGFGLLALLAVCWLSLAAPFAEVRREAASVVLLLWAWLATGLVWLAFGQGRLAGVIQNQRDWFDPARPLQPGMQRVPLKPQHGDWVGMLLRMGGLLQVGQPGLVYWIKGTSMAGLFLLPWLALLLWLFEGFARILWRRVAEVLVLTEDRLIWHRGPCQIQIPYAQLEEVLRGFQLLTTTIPRRELVLVTRGMMTVVARPGWPLWLVYWLLPRRELVVQSGLAHESFRLRPENELLVLETLAERAPHLVARGTGLLAARSEKGLEPSPDGTARPPLHAVLARQSQRRVLLDGSPFRSVLLSVLIWLLLPIWLLIGLEEAWWVHQSRPYLMDWLDAGFITTFLVWFAFLGLLLWLRQRGLPQVPPSAWPRPSAGDPSFRLVPGRWAWLGYGGQVLRLVVLGMALLLVGRVRVVVDLPALAIFEGLVVGIGLTLATRLLRQIGVELFGGLWLLEDRVLCDRGWTQAAIAYEDLQEATLTAPLGAPGDAGELRLRSAALVQIPARRGWWSLPLVPPLGGRELPTYWQDRTWLVTLAEPARFLQELGPHVPQLVRIDTGWITPLPSTGAAGHTAGDRAADDLEAGDPAACDLAVGDLAVGDLAAVDLAGPKTDQPAGQPAEEPAAQSTTNSTSRQ